MADMTDVIDRRALDLVAAKKPNRQNVAQWPDPYAPTDPRGAPLDPGYHWTGETMDAPKEHGGGKTYPMEEDAAGSLKANDGKYPRDFVRLYNTYLNEYVKHAPEIARERQSETGTGPWTSRMEQLDGLKGTMDYVRAEGSPKTLTKLPLGMQDYIASSPDFEEWQKRFTVDPGSNEGLNAYDRARRTEPEQPPNPQPEDIDRLFGFRAWGRQFRTREGLLDSGGAPTPEWKS